jgi:KDO2-lipid IV(A) lauroyltransferase
MTLPTGRTAPVPRRWTLHGLNSGTIFSLTYHGVRVLPRPVSYALGRIGSTILAHAHPESTDALVDNLRAVFPEATGGELRRRGLATYNSYTRDVVDFLRAVEQNPATEELFEYDDDATERVRRLHARGQGVLLVSGHYGNWEAGGVLLSRCLKLPLTVVAMREASPTVNRIRQDLRQRLGIQTIEVRQSLDTPLQIRAALARNSFVALLVDRHVGRDRLKVTFLGRPALFLRTPFVMSALTGAPLAVCAIDRGRVRRFRASVGPEITISPDGDREAAIQRAAQQVADRLSELVRARPECWYQFYRYWDAQADNYAGLD